MSIVASLVWIAKSKLDVESGSLFIIDLDHWVVKIFWIANLTKLGNLQAEVANG